MRYYLEDSETVLKSLGTGENGLDAQQAEERTAKYGKNELVSGRRKSIFKRLAEQLSDPMIIVLIVAAVISGIVGEAADMIIILLVVIVNSVLGVVQEGRAEKAIEALKKMASPYSKVRRRGRVAQVRSSEIVPGDIVLLEAGDAIPADMRLIEAVNLKIEEASLTGESVPVDKISSPISASDGDVPLGDRNNMAYMGTSVVYGRGEGAVVSTGMATEMGKIASIISNTGEGKTPLQKKLADLSRVLSIAVLGICVFIFLLSVLENGGFSGGHVLDMFLTSVSLAVAAIPEGLVAVVTVVLSIGVTKMSQRNAIIRRLTAVETLGCTQVICSDKTGTLTQNRMTVVDTYGDKDMIAAAVALCNDAELNGDDGEVVGEPTESALVRYAFERGINKTELQRRMPREAELPFDSVRKMMSTIHKDDRGALIQYTKGAPDVLLDRCAFVHGPDGDTPLSDDLRNGILAENRRMAGKALRVIGCAEKHLDSLPEKISSDTLESGLTFIGLVGMIDPIRPEARDAIKTCVEAGIKPIMITGDHRDTAVAIARELNIITDESEAAVGSDISRMSNEEFESKFTHYSVYARVQPEHKVRIVSAWRKKGMITAMTGDGVNDAPALKTADIGVGMGITGTDVAKNVSDMILADDNFASIVYAVEEGRRIYDNIRKAIQFLLSTNLSEVIALFIATLMNWRLLSPIHILWINLITDAFPAIALGMEGAEEDIMKRPPRDADEGIFAGGLGIDVIYQGITVAILTLVSYAYGCGESHITGMTMAFVTLSLSEIFHSLNMRSRTRSIFKLKKHNAYLFGAMVLSFVLVLSVLYIPGLNTLFKLAPLSAADLLASIGIALAIIPVVEIVKLARSGRGK